MPDVTPDVAKSMLNVPADTIGPPVTLNLVELAIAMLVTVPPLLAFPPVAEIVISPVLPLSETPVPAIKLLTPALSKYTVPDVALDDVVRPEFEFAVKVLKLLAFANNVPKLVFVFVNALYRESLPTDSLGRPILILCCPEIAIIVSFLILYLSIRKKDYY